MSDTQRHDIWFINPQPFTNARGEEAVCFYEARMEVIAESLEHALIHHRRIFPDAVVFNTKRIDPAVPNVTTVVEDDRSRALAYEITTSFKEVTDDE